MYEIAKRFHFSASHQLRGLAPGHPCGRLHGHNYRAELVLAGPTGPAGMVLDYGELAPFAAWVAERFDHRHLNGFLADPTAENIAAYMYEWASKRWPAVAAVRVSETPSTWAEYRPGPRVTAAGGAVAAGGESGDRRGPGLGDYVLVEPAEHGLTHWGYLNRGADGVLRCTLVHPATRVVAESDAPEEPARPMYAAEDLKAGQACWPDPDRPMLVRARPGMPPLAPGSIPPAGRPDPPTPAEAAALARARGSSPDPFPDQEPSREGWLYPQRVTAGHDGVRAGVRCVLAGGRAVPAPGPGPAPMVAAEDLGPYQEAWADRDGVLRSSPDAGGAAGGRARRSDPQWFEAAEGVETGRPVVIDEADGRVRGWRPGDPSPLFAGGPLGPGGACYVDRAGWVRPAPFGGRRDGAHAATGGPDPDAAEGGD